MINLIIGIIGVLLTGIGVFVGIRPLQRINISFILLDNFSLFNKVTKRFDQINIQYSNKTVKENIFLLKGCYINRGYKDIIGKNLIKPLRFSIEKPYKIIEYNITKTSKDLEVSAEKISKKEIEFNWDLLKRGEYFTFDLLIEQSKKTDNELNLIPRKKYHSLYRVENSRKNISHRDYSVFEKYGSIKYLLFAIALLLGVYSYDNFTKIPYDLTHYIEKDSAKYVVSLAINSSDSIIVKNSNYNIEYKLSSNQKLKELGVIPYLSYSKFEQTINYINGGLYSIITLLLLFFGCVMTYRIRILNKIVKDNNYTQHRI
ncbi:MAG TPA: hypothetical protein DCQ26_14435 [Marinilabiliales bacterium]|nr:MAG: hypothetical protein A2W95_01380 [Bacteroidetes bacterium GWA2_40_14]OFX58170.1 MAG: hypothetical protein A2W84_09465 [Bacteroidetes bacterium GWC2_40_13]OFX74963.1 MAG: hypothetical protein A2W96_04820 [Bacteroidetes bacterium GWD2_40_43]OFX95101.1 MAG: hypothetical protein A2W97_09210 [Bacteroidetes bacterium GWE2_40_63]OFY18961.1 MAG: hypothetical protein A2W88_01435 [Bacteroidetes bacterium GWF2_40_13]OFZ30919.1 MAG: hypothetical protein A2437_14845 [Bacteroidetes bacterium RIFOXYC